MDAYFQAQITGWCSFELNSMEMLFHEGTKEYIFPVTWKSQKTSLLPRCMRLVTDTMFLFKLESLYVNRKDAGGYLRCFADARVISLGVSLRGKGEKDLKITGMTIYDGKHRSLILPAAKAQPVFISYKTHKTPGKLPGGIPKVIRNLHGHMGYCIKFNGRKRTAKYLFDTGYEKEIPIRELKGSGCGRKCLL